MSHIVDSVRDCKLLYCAAVQHESAMILLRSKLSAITRRLGFSELKRENVALVTSEIVTNQVKHAGGKGMLQIWQQPGPILDIFALDYGPGIGNLHQAQEDGFSTANTLGKGLGSIRRLSDVAYVYSQQESPRPVKRWSGTAILSRFSATGKLSDDTGNPKSNPYSIGLYSRALSDERFTGDRVYLQIEGSKVRWLHLDGLGHGEEAEKATADLAGLLPHCATSTAILGAVDRQLQGTRGAVAIVGEMNGASKSLEILGVGDMHAHFFTHDEMHNFAFSPGVLGKEHKSPAENFLGFNPKCRVITASDGIRRNWDAANFPGLFYQHPQLIAYVVGNIMGRISDDQSVCVVGTN